MANEIERKWNCVEQRIISLLQHQHEYEFIQQRYFHEENDEHAVGRVRIYYKQGVHRNPSAERNFKRAEITIKSGSGLTRAEANVPVDQTLAGHLMFPNADVILIEKKRYTFPYQSHMVELDVYHGDNAGLVHIEIEFKSEEEALAFEAPEWFGEEVTNDMSHTNASLQNKPFCCW